MTYINLKILPQIIDVLLMHSPECTILKEWHNCPIQSYKIFERFFCIKSKQVSNEINYADHKVQHPNLP